jgi:hypothetical protein
VIPIIHAYHSASVGSAGYHEPMKIKNTAYTWHFAIRTRHRASQLIAALILSVTLAILATTWGDASVGGPGFAWERRGA